MDAITSIRVRNLRTLADVDLELRGLTVLIGPNGSGKSSLVEACAMLGRTTSSEFASQVVGVHGGMTALRRAGTADPVALGARIGNLTYEVQLDGTGNLSVGVETLLDPARVLFRRDGSKGRAEDRLTDLDVTRTLMSRAGPDPAWASAAATLAAIEVHLPWDFVAAWGARSVGRPIPARSPQLVGPTDRLDLVGSNLANVYHRLKNELGDEHWSETMELVRLGIGEDVETVVLVTSGDGHVTLALKLRGSDLRLPGAYLSDGQLSWLAFVALTRLPVAGGLLVIDEPELHFEPRLLARVVDLLEEHAAVRPVLISTHSDRLLDNLRDPAGSVVVCELDAQRRTVLRRPDRAALDEWLKSYAGYGSLRAAGVEPLVLKTPA